MSSVLDQIEAQIDAAEKSGDAGRMIATERGDRPNVDPPEGTASATGVGDVQEEPGETQGAQPEREAPAEPAPVSYKPFRLGREEVTPEQLKDPEAWNRFRANLERELEARGPRQEKFTQTQQQLAEQRKQLEADMAGFSEQRTLVEDLVNRLSNPNTFGPTILHLAKELGATIPLTEEQFKQIVPPDPSARALEAVNDLERRLQERERAREAEATIAEIQRAWDGLQGKHPGVLTADDFHTWIALQANAGLSRDEAASQILNARASLWSPENFDKLPEERRASLEKHIKAKYLKAKTQSTTVGGLAAAGSRASATAPTLQAWKPDPKKSVAQQRDEMERMLDGVAPD